MAKHKHAALMLQYAQDWAETDEPWKRWEVTSHRNEWVALCGHPYWREESEYRRKPRLQTQITRSMRMNINQIIEQHALWLDTNGKEGSRANLTHANLACANLVRANLSRANLYGANLTRANLEDTNLGCADLDSVNLYGANLTRANLEGANLFGANLNGVNLTHANLEGTNLTRANLTRAKLEGANLDCANLEGASGNLSNLKSVFCDTYPVTYTAEVMQIGCQCHKLEDWWSFDDARIIEMEGKAALKWWRTWKPILQQIIATSPANATELVIDHVAMSAQ